MTPGKIYYFVVSSINATAESANSAEVSARLGLLNRTGWVASASSSNAPDPPANAIDGNINSRWSTGANQVPGQWFQVDMGSTNILSALVLDCGASTGDYPRAYQVYLSKDGVNWGIPVATGNGSAVTTISYPTHNMDAGDKRTLHCEWPMEFDGIRGHESVSLLSIAVLNRAGTTPLIDVIRAAANAYHTLEP